MRISRFARFAALVAIAALAFAVPALARDKPNEPSKGAEALQKSTRAGLTGPVMPNFEIPGVPKWTPPAQYQVELVMTHEGQSFSMKRHIRGASIRSEMIGQGMEAVMLERAEEPGVTYMLMPEQKQGIKTDAESMAGMSEKMGLDKAIEEHEKKAEPAPVFADVQPTFKKLGSETLNGRAADKFEATADDMSALMWFDHETGAPLRMQAKESTIDWKDYKAEAQPEKLFEVPKGYEIIDMAEQMKQLEKMGFGKGGGMVMKGGAGMSSAALSGMMGGKGMPGMSGGLSGMAGNYGSQMGQNFGQSIGSSVGASFGGPLGAMAGGYIGGAVGGWIGRKVAGGVTGAVTGGNR